jgi:formiminoglutamase
MDFLKVYTPDDVHALTRHRQGEKKIGESITVVKGEWRKFVTETTAMFFILGIAEDIGVRANHGRAGAGSAVRPAFESFLNQQDNGFIDSGAICLLGELVIADLMEQAVNLDPHNENDIAQLRDMVHRIDDRLSPIIRELVINGKIPVVIGGGHNNAFGNLKGSSQALGHPVNVINCDQHLDFRPLEGRHSGNAFSYAFQEGVVGRYSVFGIHEQYNSNAALSSFREHPERLFCHTYEDIFVREKIPFNKALAQCTGFVNNTPCGIEIDLDAITNVPSSAKTSSGISALNARMFIHHCASALKPLYLHIAEGAPVLSHIRADNKTGKLISYLVTDFIKACSNNGG